MIIDNIDKHLTDKDFFVYAKFFDLFIEKKGIEDKENFPLRYFGIGSSEDGEVFNNLFMSAQLLEISVDIEKGYDFKKQIEKAKEEIKQKSEKEQKKLLKITKKIQGGKRIKITEVADISWVWYEIYNHIRFVPSECKIPKEIEKVFRSELNKYLDNLIDDNLSITRNNYYKFETQKKALITLIEKDNKISLYGNNFIIKERINNEGILMKIPDFCLIQIVYALQKLGYLKVLDVWESREYPKDSFDRERVDFNKEPAKYINTNIILEDVFMDELNDSFKEKNPKVYFEKYDDKKKVLRFAGKNITLAKKGKDTDAIRLLETLLKEPEIELWSITKEMYDRKMKEYKEQQYDLGVRKDELTRADENYYLVAKLVLNLAKNAEEIFESSEIEEKNQLLKFILQNSTVNRKKPEFSMREPFKTVAEYSGCPIGLRRQDSNLRQID